MSHPLVIALFDSPASAAAAARALHALGIAREQISVVAQNHDEEGALAEQWDATPGAEVEDSRAASAAFWNTPIVKHRALTAPRAN